MEEKGYLKIVKYCLYRERCKSEVIEKLTETDLPSSKYAQIIQRLEKDNYLSEKRYVEIYVRAKFKIKKWGRKKIEHGLKIKKIPAELIKAELESIDDESYFESIKELINKKQKELKSSLSPFEKDVRIIRYLVSKGYEYDLTKDALKEIKKN